MERHEKVNNIKKIREIIKHCEEKIADYQEKITEIENFKEEQSKELSKAENSKSELIIFLGTRKSRRPYVFPIDIYYDADFGRLRTTHDISKRTTADVDLGDFFYNYTHDINSGYYETIFNTSAAFEALLGDMFKKKTYNSWDEVKTDLLRINELYAKPKFNENLENYKKRVLSKNEDNNRRKK